MNSHKTAIAYARVASPENATKNLQEQVQAIQKFAQQQDTLITEIFQEIASSFGERREFTKMIEKIRRGEIKPSYIYVYDWARFSRNQAELMAFHNELQEFNVEIISVTPPHEIQFPSFAAMYMRVGTEEQLH